MPDPLKKYRAMRDFGDTPEPSGGEPKRGKLPIFVIQKHQASRLHYDFRLEMEGVLKSWAVPKGPSYDPTVKRLAMMTEDHPYDYAGFEGVIPHGNYGAGNVIIWDNGTWELIGPGEDPVRALEQGDLKFKMYGRKMFGEWALFRIKGRSPKGNEWLLVKHRDKFANDKVDVTAVAPRSIISNKLVEEVGGERIWLSNRPGSSSDRRAPTVASALEAKKKPRLKREKALPAKGISAPSSAVKKARSAATRSRPAPPRAASARSRSSPARSPRAARPTPRRRPR
jgi:bifunctional non-homologous end joining protein LigD